MNKITPEKYRSILDGIQLSNILLKNISSNIDHRLLPEILKVNITDKASFENTEEGFTIENKYSLSVKNKKRNVLKIEATYLIEFTSDNEINEGFFEIYKETSLPLNVWPFFRELVNTITSRMYIPPLTIPLFKR